MVNEFKGEPFRDMIVYSNADQVMIVAGQSAKRAERVTVNMKDTNYAREMREKMVGPEA